MKDNDMMRIVKMLISKIASTVRANTVDTVRRVPAEVIEADNESRYADVRLLSVTNSNQIMHLMNCSGQNLKTGDAVWVEYMYGLDNAFIAILNNGKPWGW